jgi:site-specific recombinase XerD
MFYQIGYIRLLLNSIKKTAQVNGAVFCVPEGREPLTQSGVREILRRLQHDSENSHEFHAFRRFYGLSLYNETHDIYFVSRMLDHSNIEVTKRYLDIKQVLCRMYRQTT